MSVQRSPPNNLHKLKPASPVTRHNSDSALDINTRADIDDTYSNTTKRTKRTSVSEIKTMFEEFKLQQDQKFDILNDTLGTIMAQNQAIQKSVANLTARHQELLTKMFELEKENMDYKNRVMTLEKRSMFLKEKRIVLRSKFAMYPYRSMKIKLS